MATRSALKRFWRDQSGATAIEYGMIGALIFVVIIGAVTAFGNKTADIMATASDAITAAIGG